MKKYNSILIAELGVTNARLSVTEKGNRVIKAKITRENLIFNLNIKLALLCH